MLQESTKADSYEEVDFQEIFRKAEPQSRLMGAASGSERERRQLDQDRDLAAFPPWKIVFGASDQGRFPLTANASNTVPTRRVRFLD